MAKSNKILWTDKLQAIAAFVAIPSAIFVFYNLFDSDKAQEQQLKQLTNLANQAIQQTEILREELAVLTDRNRILVEQLEIDKEKWSKEIRPEFSIQKIRQVCNENLHNGTFKYFETPFVNQGGAAHIEDVILSKKNTIEVHIPKTFVGRNGILLINFEKTKEGECQLDFSVIFRDIDNNRYIQRFYDNDEYLIVATSPEPFNK